MPLHLKHYVNEGHYGFAADQPFGTAGMGTCVGVIVQYTALFVFCGHMDASYEPRESQKDQFVAKAMDLLDRAFDVEDWVDVTAISVSTPGGTRASRYIVEAAQQWAANQHLTLTQFGNSCIYINEGRQVLGTEEIPTFGKEVNEGDFTVTEG